MPSILARYRERMQHEHGWEVELTCPACGTTALPVFNGWTPSNAIHFGNNATIYANLSCPKCGSNLKDAAGKKLGELFADERIPPTNRRMMIWFLVLLIGFLLILTAGIFLGALAGWWNYQAFLALTLLPLLIQPSIMWFNWRIASLRCQCECGRPAYKFMGLLGRSYCYRCSSCGKRLRLRD